MRLLVWAVVAFVAGCALSVPTVAPDGRPAHVIHCGGTWHDWGSCYAEAGRLCGHGWEVIFSDTDARNDRLYLTGSRRTRDMLVVCH